MTGIDNNNKRNARSPLGKNLESIGVIVQIVIAMVISGWSSLKLYIETTIKQKYEYCYSCFCFYKLFILI